MLETDHMEMYANTAKEIPKGGKTNNKIMKKKILKSSRPSTEIIPEDSASPEEVCWALAIFECFAVSFLRGFILFYIMFEVVYSYCL